MVLGIVGAQSVMFAKSSGELIQLSLQGRNQFNRVLTYVILAGLVLTISVQVHCLYALSSELRFS